MKRSKQYLLFILLFGAFINLGSYNSVFSQIFDHNGNTLNGTGSTSSNSGIDEPVFEDNSTSTGNTAANGGGFAGTTSVDADDDDPGGPIDPVDDIPLDGGVAVLLAVGIASGYNASRKKII